MIQNKHRHDSGPILGHLRKKICIRDTPTEFRAEFLCLFTEQHVSDTLGGFGFVLLDDVRIEVLRSAGAGVAKLGGNGHDVGSVGQQYRGHRVPECVGIDMGQAVTLGEVPEPSGDAVRVHMIPVVLGEYIAGIDPPVTVGKLQPELLKFVLPQKRHCFSRQSQIADITCLCGAFRDPFTFGDDQLPVDLYPVFFEVHFIPFKPHDLAPAAAGDKKHMSNELPFERFGLQRFQYFGNGFRLEVVGGFFLLP